MDERVTVRERGVTDGCPFCRDTLRADDDVLACGTCETRLHAACFRENGLACTVLGCGGKAVVPATSRRKQRKNEKRKNRETRRERKRRLEEEQEAARRKALDAWRPATRTVAPQTADHTPWYQGPIGLVGILSLLIIVPPAMLELGGAGAVALASLAFCAGLGWIGYIGLYGKT